MIAASSDYGKVYDSAPPPELGSMAATRNAERSLLWRRATREAVERGRWLIGVAHSRRQQSLQPYCCLRGVCTGLMLFQSTSSWILGKYEKLLSEHMLVISFLTMLVGAGGNAGAQAAVASVRGIALGRPEFASARDVLGEALPIACMLSTVLGAFAWLRVRLIYGGDGIEATAIAMSCCCIVGISVTLGAILPYAIRSLGFDPAHAGATIQVIMDISGVAITCFVCLHLLPSATADGGGGDLV